MKNLIFAVVYFLLFSISTYIFIPDGLNTWEWWALIIIMGITILGTIINLVKSAFTKKQWDTYK